MPSRCGFFREKPLLAPLLISALLTGSGVARADSDVGRKTSAPDPSQEELLEKQRDLASRRAAWNALFRRDSSGRVLSENRLRALERACELPVDPSMLPSAAGGPRSGVSVSGALTFAGRTWQSIGPRSALAKTTSNRAWGNVAGRISGLAIHPNDPSIVLLASATGGIWKSTDSGDSWRPVSDGAPSLAVSSVAFAPSNPSIAFAATGEVDNAGGETFPAQSLGTYLGAGLLRSGDGGETWSRVDLDLPANAVLSRVLVHPSDPQRVLVGIYLYHQIAANTFSSGGIYRSTDGGVHFTQTFNHRISDLVQDPADASRVYLGAGRCPTCPASGVHVSTDFGQTWNPSLTPANPAAGFTSPSGRIRLGATRVSGATILYASVLDADNQHTKAGIYRSPDGGVTWVKKTVATSMCPGPPGLNQCSYDHWIGPAAGSDSTVFFGSIDLYKSSDGAGSWVKLTDNYNGQGIAVPVHPDQHAGVVSPFAPNTIYFANDGGLYRSTDAGQTFQNLNATLTLAQFNGVALHPDDPEFAIGGTQDNGNLRYTGQAQWTDRTSGDGGFNLIRRDSPAQILSGHYFAYMVASSDGGTNYRNVTACGALMDCDSDDPLDPMAFYPPVQAAPSPAGTVFLATNRMWSNPSFGGDPAAWTPRSSASILETEGDVFTALEVLGDGSGPIWAGSVLEGVFFSNDGGATFEKRNSGLPAAIVSKIVAVTGDGRSAYVTFGGFLGLPSRHVFRTSDGGFTWANISGNLPDVPITTLAIDPADPTDIFVGSDVGVFRSVNGGATWTSFNEGLPNASITDLRFHRFTGDLYAATYGRGIFRIKAPALAPLADFAASPSLLVAGQPILFVDTSANAPTSWLWNFGDPASGGANSSTEKNPKHTFSAPGTYIVSLTATNAAGSNQAIKTIAVQAGGSCVRCKRVVPFH